ncbi:unnamed protein product [Parnassius mnemosyne]|uniref:Uncharacterized protein n=1 Tax=Parnassius mnemosyne TaxID=213953 RepID=A0AAV1L4N9_9NEOP
MAPKTEQENKSAQEQILSNGTAKEEVVVTGVAGYFPDSDSVKQFQENLFNKVDLISKDERRWKLFHTGLTQRTGKINFIDKFDASYFGIDYKEAHCMDPMARLLLEKCYEALIDAGINPEELRGTRCAVVIGACFSESEKAWFYDKMEVNDYGINGCSRSSFATRISKWLGVSGPSYIIDTACSSSMYAIEHAYRAIINSNCDTAIVAGANLCLHPIVSLQFSSLGVVSPDGRCKSFDDRANGYARSEAVVVCILQKAKNARRVYAKLVHAKTNCDGYKEQGITYPAGHIQKVLLEKFYEEVGVSPSTLEYLEAHGTGTSVGDLEELKAIDAVFSAGRPDPLLIGSVKSNMGHSEAAAGVCALAKLCIAYHSGYIPPNINYLKPREEVTALTEGRLQVVTEKRPWNRGRAAASSFGFGGANAHLLLEKYARNKINNGLPTDDLPRLVCVSGRTQSAVDKIFDDLESKPVDAEVVRLWHAIYANEISKHNYRGYILLGTTPTKSIQLARHVQHSLSDTRKPVWFVYSGLGTQWPAMGKDLLRISTFANAINICHKTLESKGIKLSDIISKHNINSFENIVESFVGIVAVQIGMTDVLKSVGIKPDYIVGHGIGELSCAYADECLTAEEAILSAYYCGLALTEVPTVKGSMAAVNLGYKKMKDECPPELDIAYHNGPRSSVVSGPANIVENFVNKLTSQGTLAEEISCSNVACHSRYISEASSKLTQSLKEVILEPRTRSNRWLSTSVARSCWNEPKATEASPEYFTNNLLNPVLFEETSRLIEDNAIVIEIAPHGVLCKSLGQPYKDLLTVELSQMDSKDNVQVLLTALGRLYEAGLNLNLANLYPQIKFPVSQETPMLSHLVEWEHRENWDYISYKTQKKLNTGERTVKVCITDEDKEYITGHCIDGRILYPGTGYLILVWETFALMRGKVYNELSVVFEDIRLHRATTIPKQGNLEFIITIHKESGEFELSENSNTVATGRIYSKENVGEDFVELPPLSDVEDSNLLRLTTKDFYKELRLRGYQHSGLFRGILDCNVESTHGRVIWNNNWVVFLDYMLQMNIIAYDSRDLYLPTFIKKLSIDVQMHYDTVAKLNSELSREQFIDVRFDRDMNITRSGGVDLSGLQMTPVLKKPSSVGAPIMESYKFVPNFGQHIMQLQEAINVHTQLIHENVQTFKIKCVELVDEEYSKRKYTPIIEIVANCLDTLPLIQSELIIVSNESIEVSPRVKVEKKKEAADNATLCIGANLLQRTDVLDQYAAMLRGKGFILSREAIFPDVNAYLYKYNIVSAYEIDTEVLVLIRPKFNVNIGKCIRIGMEDENYSWIEKVKECINANEKVILYAQNEIYNGILGLVNCLRREAGGDLIQGYLIADESKPNFNPNIEYYKQQLNKDLAMNVFKNGQWGTYRHVQLIGLEKTSPVPHAYVNVQNIGDLSSLRWFEGPLGVKLSSKQDNVSLVNVHCSALNFRDVMTATGRVTVDAVARGRLEQDCVQGIEISGQTANGSRIAAMAHCGISNLISLSDNLVCNIPNEWSYEEGATIPVAYATSYMAMVIIGKIKPGESILIHAGTGGVGQAAINLAFHIGCEVFTTVGTPAKRDFIKKLFPQLKDSHIGNSRDVSFEEMVRRETNGKGVDLVLNSLAEEKLLASVRCLGYRGRFLEIGKFDISKNTQVDMHAYHQEISFHGIMLDYILDKENYRLRQELQKLIALGIQSGAVRPLTFCTFEKYEIESAYRYMAAGKHIGKVIIKIRDEDSKNVINPVPVLIDALPRYMCRGDRVYIVIGGLGGFGLELVDWLIMRGARKVLLGSSKGVSNGYQTLRLRLWSQYGADIKISTHDIATESGCVEMLNMAKSMGPVEAIFNLAAVLRDATFVRQTPETFKTSFKPKALATMLLDTLSRKLCPELQTFVVFSSLACGRGNAGQTNYGFSNSVMEKICEKRRQDGLHALAVQWGAIGDVGLVADMQDANLLYEIGGTLLQPIKSCLQTLDKFLKQDDAIVSSYVVAEKKVGGTDNKTVVDAVAQIMGLKNLKSVSYQASLAELGMDSMISIEIKQTLEREFEIFLTAQDIRALTFARLEEMAKEQNTTPNAVESSVTSAKPDTGRVFVWNGFGDEVTASQAYVHMQTRVSSGEDSQEKGPANIMFMIPGIEGCAYTLERLCKKLNTRVCVLQPGLGYRNDSLSDMVNRFYETIKDQLSRDVPFKLLGYSFGTLPLLELVAKLEKDGYKGNVYCLDGSPEFAKAMLDEEMPHSNETELHNNIISFIYSAVSNPDSNDTSLLLEKLRNIPSLEEKVNYVIDTSKQTINYSKNFLKSFAISYYDRVLMIKNFNIGNISKIKSPIFLLRAKDGPFANLCKDNYGLSKFTDSTVEVYSFKGNHITILEDDECASFINKNI